MATGSRFDRCELGSRSTRFGVHHHRCLVDHQHSAGRRTRGVPRGFDLKCRAVTDRQSGGNHRSPALRRLALFANVVGAAGSIALTLYFGRHNAFRLITAMFVVWVLSPFAALFFADAKSSGWPALTRTTLRVLMVVVAVASLLIYADGAFHPRARTAAFPFVITPPLEWIAIVAGLGLAWLMSDRTTGVR